MNTASDNRWSTRAWYPFPQDQAGSAILVSSVNPLSVSTRFLCPKSSLQYYQNRILDHPRSSNLLLWRRRSLLSELLVYTRNLPLLVPNLLFCSHLAESWKEWREADLSLLCG